MKKSFILLAFSAAASVHAYSFADITHWVGSGSQRAAMVVDWNGGPGPQTVVWGYRFDGTKTGQDMLLAVAASDPGFYYQYVGGVSYTTVFGLGLDRNANGFSKNDPGDSYAEGWFSNGYWGYYSEETPTSSDPSWTYASSGFDTRTLGNNSWDGWSWQPNFVGDAPRLSAVPEPGSGIAFGIGSVGCLLRRRRSGFFRHP